MSSGGIGRVTLTLPASITIQFTWETACSRLIPLPTWTFPPPRITRAPTHNWSWHLIHILNKADTIPPTVAISSLTNGQTFTSATIAVSGTASDAGCPSSGVSLVQAQMNGTGGAWQTASGTNNWSASVSLNSGANTIYVRSRDVAGNYSSVALVNVTYNPPPPVFGRPYSQQCRIANDLVRAFSGRDGCLGSFQRFATLDANSNEYCHRLNSFIYKRHKSGDPEPILPRPSAVTQPGFNLCDQTLLVGAMKTASPPSEIMPSPSAPA